MPNERPQVSDISEPAEIVAFLNHCISQSEGDHLSQQELESVRQCIETLVFDREQERYDER